MCKGQQKNIWLWKNLVFVYNAQIKILLFLESYFLYEARFLESVPFFSAPTAPVVSELWNCYLIKHKYLADNKTQVLRCTQIHALYIVNGLYANNLGSNSAHMKHIHLKEIRISILSVLIHIYVSYMHVGIDCLH